MKAGDARKYIIEWGPRCLGRPVDFCDTTDGRRIYFNNMTDEEALKVATMLKNVEDIANDQ